MEKPKDMQLLNRLIVIICCAILVTGCIGSQSQNFVSENVLHITDIHFDPFTSCGQSSQESAQQCVLLLMNESNPANWIFPNQNANDYGDETNYKFLSTGLQHLTPVLADKKITKIFMTGDLLSHHFPTQFYDYVPNGTESELTQFSVSVMNYVLYQISQAVPGAKMYYILGNNDTDQADYSFPSESFMNLAATKLATYMVNPIVFTNTFATGGYYVVPFNSQTDIINLNFNPLTEENAGDLVDEQIANQQFIWLESVLSNLRRVNKTAIILQHEPFGANVYNVLMDYNPKYNLQAKYTMMYFALYQKYSDVIQNYYYGHYHMDAISAYGNILGLGTLGFSVDYQNNPGFKILQISPSGKLLNYSTYYNNYIFLKNLEWTMLYSFNSEYNITPENYLNYFHNIIQVGLNDDWLKYIAHYSGNAVFMPYNDIPSNFESAWPYYYCQMTVLESNGFNQCITKHN